MSAAPTAFASSEPSTRHSLGAAPGSAFVADCNRAREIWGLRESWRRDANGECKSDRAWSGLIWSAAMHSRDGNWTRTDQIALEAAQIEYEMRVRLSLGMPNDKLRDGGPVTPGFK